MKKLSLIAIIISLALPGLTQSQGLEYLDINNISARFNANGNHFWNSENAIIIYPKTAARKYIVHICIMVGRNG